MKFVKRFAGAAGIAAFASGMILMIATDWGLAAGASPLNPYSLGATVGTSTGTHPAANASGTAKSSNAVGPSTASPPGTSATKASTTAAPSASPNTVGPSGSRAVSNEVRDHRPGGNADPCLQPKNTCSASDRNASITEWRKRQAVNIGLDGDPCFRTKSCTRTQLLESLIARFEKGHQKGFCDSTIKGQGCAQIFTFTNGSGGDTQLTIYFKYNGGPPTEADKQRVLAILHEAYDRSLGGGGTQAPTTGTALKLQ